MIHFVRTKNLPYSVEEVKKVTSECSVCAEIKPRFYRPNKTHLVKSTQPFEKLSIDFKGPLPSVSKNKYLLTIIDEYSRFPYAFACADMTASSVIKCLVQLFSIFGMPQYIHSDRGPQFMSQELRTFLHDKGIATSRSTPYNPRGNGQVERLNGTIWGAAWHRTKKRACGDRRLCVRIPLTTRFLCAVQRFSLPVYLVYVSLPLRP